MRSFSHTSLPPEKEYELELTEERTKIVLFKESVIRALWVAWKVLHEWKENIRKKSENGERGEGEREKKIITFLVSFNYTNISFLYFVRYRGQFCLRNFH